MKKFLLLGATALLSTVTSLANADPLPALPNATANLKVWIGLFNAAGITVEEDTIDFGVLAATGAHEDASVRLNPATDEREITGSGVSLAGGEAERASLFVKIPTGYTATLNLPKSVTLYNQDASEGKGYMIGFSPEKHLDENAGYGDIVYDKYFIGGSVNLSGEFHGVYQGSFTVTAVYSEASGG